MPTLRRPPLQKTQGRGTLSTLGIRPRSRPLKQKLILALLCCSNLTMSGCFMPARLVPVAGPAKLEPHEVIIKPSGAFSRGSFYAELKHEKLRTFHEDVCKGRWTPATAPLPAGKNDMTSVWDTALGDNYYEAQVIGAKRCARGTGTCDHHVTLVAEICQYAGGRRAGVARDSAGSIYNIVFEQSGR